MSLSVVGYSMARRRAIAFSSTVACSAPTPGLSMAKTSSERLSLFPDPIPKQQNGRGTRLVITGQKSSAQHGRNMQHVEDSRGCPLHGVRLWRIAAFAENAVFAVRGFECFERRGLRPVIAKCRQ